MENIMFDEHCDVLEFDRDDNNKENPFVSSDEDNYCDGQTEQHEELEPHHS